MQKLQNLTSSFATISQIQNGGEKGHAHWDNWVSIHEKYSNSLTTLSRSPTIHFDSYQLFGRHNERKDVLVKSVKSRIFTTKNCAKYLQNDIRVVSK